MSSGGFWPGEGPAAEQENAPEPEATVADPPGWPQQTEAEAKTEPEPEPEVEPAAVAAPSVAEPEPAEEAAPEEESQLVPVGHLPGELDIPDDVAVLEGSPSGADRTVGIVVSRFNGEISNRLLESALETLTAAGVAEERITVMPVPGAFELPIGAMALAKTRRYSCVIALGCVVRGETAHFDYRRRRGCVRPPARRARDGRAGGVRRAHGGHHGAGRSAGRQGRRRRARRARDGRPLLAGPQAGQA